MSRWGVTSLSLTDMYRVTGFLYLDCSDPSPHRCHRYLGIQLGDIISVGSRLNISRALLRSLIASLQMSENYGLLKRFGTAE